MARIIAAGIAAAAGSAACGSTPASPSNNSTSSNPGAGFPAGTLSLAASPIDQSAIRWITPLGNLNPPDHTVPSDHIYFYFADPNAGESITARRTPFFAPGSGTVTFIIGGAGQESKVMFRQTSTFSYYVDHVILDAAMPLGTTVTAGQRIGVTGNAYAVDLGVVNDSITVPFLVPSRYNNESLNADAPLKYFSEPVRSQLYARVQRLGSQLDGLINYDVAGRLSGNWFLQGNTALAFAFVYDTYDPSRVLISSSGLPVGVYEIAAGDPAPRDVSAASGKVIYSLARTNGGPNPPHDSIPVFLLVQMTDDTHLRSEFFSARPADFTAAARMWIR